MASWWGWDLTEYGTNCRKKTKKYDVRRKMETAASQYLDSWRPGRSWALNSPAVSCTKWPWPSLGTRTGWLPFNTKRYAARVCQKAWPIPGTKRLAVSKHKTAWPSPATKPDQLSYTKWNSHLAVYWHYMYIAWYHLAIRTDRLGLLILVLNGLRTLGMRQSSNLLAYLPAICWHCGLDVS